MVDNGRFPERQRLLVAYLESKILFSNFYIS